MTIEPGQQRAGGPNGSSVGRPALAGVGPAGGTAPERTPEGKLTELRVHGVSGTPPSALLQDPWTVRVAGDELSGFHRRGQATVAMMRPSPTVPEAYSWGNLTSGAAARAVWLLLLPFMLVNLAYWMRPTRRGRLDGTSRWLLRLLALSLTPTLVLTAAGIGMDLVGWQCTAAGRSCGADRTWLRWMTAGAWSEPGRRLMVAAVVPAALVALLWFVARRTWHAYEEVEPSGSTPVEGAEYGDGGELPMAHPKFWRGMEQVRRLRGLHVAVAVGSIVPLLAWPALGADRLTGRELSAAAGVVLLAGAAAVVGVAAWSLRSATAMRRDGDSTGRLSWLGDRLPQAALALLLLAAAYSALPTRDRWPATATLPGYVPLVTALFTVQVGLLLAIAAVIAVQRSRRARGGEWPGSPGLAGFAAPVVGSIGLLLACAFSAGISYRAADFLDGGARPGTAGATVLETPPPFVWAGFGFLLVAVGLLLLAGWVLLLLHRGREAAAATYARQVRESEGVDAARRNPRRFASIVRLRQYAALPDRTPALLTILVVPGALATLLITALILGSGDAPRALAERHLPAAAAAVGFLTGLGTWLIGAFALGLVVLGRAAYRTAGLRRTVGILWDVGTFWPRAAHPLAPPCYAERAVPDLARRVSWLATPGPETGQVLLSAHSQGTILAAAVLMQLPAPALVNTRLLTYGCPLTRLYARYFPAYFTPEMLERSRQLVGGRWHNLHRDTDPIGGTVFPADRQPDPRVDHWLLDPVSFTCQDGDTVPPPVLGHSDYWTVPEYDRAVRALLAAQFRPEPAAAPSRS